MADSADAAEAFLDLVVGGPANAAARGVVLDADAVDRHTRYCVGLFLHGVVPRDEKAIALEEENLRLKSSMGDAVHQLDQARERLEASLQPQQG